MTTYATVSLDIAPNIPVPHGFTSRLGGVSQGSYESLNLALRPGETMEHVEQNLRRLAKALSFAPEHLVMTQQVHGDTVRVVTKHDHQGLCHRAYPACDGLVTCDPGTALLVFTADCTPILLWDPVTGACGAAHAGWRGTALNIAGKTVKAMAEAFGCRPENLRAAIGPNIGPCHFQTRSDVPQALEEGLGKQVWQYIETREDHFYPDLKAINALALKNAGVRDIHLSSACTYCQSSRYWSHRATAGNRGSQGAVILCREVTG